MARTLYPALPVQMKLALRLQQFSDHAIDPSSSVHVGVAGISPLGVNNAYAEGFAAMMRLYSHAVVDRVQVTYGVIPNDAYGGDQPMAQRSFLACSSIMPWNDYNAIVAVPMDSIISQYESKSRLVGPLQAQHEVTFYHSVDLRKALANPHEEYYASRSTNAGVITTPALNANIGSTPIVVFSAFNRDNQQPRYFQLRRDVVYHITFSMRHASSATAAP